MIRIEVRDAELMQALTERAAELGIGDAAIVMLIGGVDRFTLSTMPADDASRDVITAYDQPGEMHGTGEIRDGRVHIHATMAVEGDQGLAGHLHSAEIRTHFAAAVLLPFPPGR